MNRIEVFLLTNVDGVSKNKILSFLEIDLFDLNIMIEKFNNDQTKPYFIEQKDTKFYLTIKESWYNLLPDMQVRYSQAFLEVLSVIVFKQPATRAEIEYYRGVHTSNNILKLLFDLNWIKIDGFKDIVGKPEYLVTTEKFLKDFNLNSKDDLPDISNLESTLNLEAEKFIQNRDIQINPITSFKDLLKEIDSIEVDVKENFQDYPIQT